ncbi:putative REJ domain-containing protein 3, partial [Homarus americanus]
MLSLVEVEVTYEVMVMVEKDTRYALAKVLVEVMSVAQPVIDIMCADAKLCHPVFSGLLINPSSRVALESMCTSSCHDHMTYTWSITTASGQPVVEERTCPQPTTSDQTTREEVNEGEASLSPDPCPPLVRTGKAARDIAISSELFLLNPDQNEFKLTLEVTTPTGTRGEYVMTLVLNKPPAGGNCTVMPPWGRAMVDTFAVTCQGWKDPEGAGIDQYTLF